MGLRNTFGFARALRPGLLSLTLVAGGALAFPSPAAARPATAPTLTIAFAPASIPVGSDSSLTFTIANPTTAAMTLVAVDTTLPGGLRVMSSTAPACGGTTTTTKPSTIVLSSGTLAAGARCHFSVDVYGFVSGVFTVTTGPVSHGDAMGASATATLSVWAPPVPALTLAATTIRRGASTVLSVRVASPHPFDSTITGIDASIEVPAGLSVARVNPDVCGGTYSNVAGGLLLSGANLPAGTYCHFEATLTGTTAGTYTIRAVVSVGSYTYDGNVATTRLTVSAPAPPPPAPTPTPTPTPSPTPSLTPDPLLPADATTPSPEVAAVEPAAGTSSDSADAAAASSSASTSLPAAWPSGRSGGDQTAPLVFGALALLVVGVIALALKRRRASGSPAIFVDAALPGALAPEGASSAGPAE